MPTPTQKNSSKDPNKSQPRIRKPGSKSPKTDQLDMELAKKNASEDPEAVEERRQSQSGPGAPGVSVADAEAAAAGESDADEDENDDSAAEAASDDEGADEGADSGSDDDDSDDDSDDEEPVGDVPPAPDREIKEPGPAPRKIKAH